MQDEVRILATTHDLRAALRELEEACDALCALRTEEIYLAMIAVPGTTVALLRLDVARRRARELVNARLLFGYHAAIRDQNMTDQPNTTAGAPK